MLAMHRMNNYLLVTYTVCVTKLNCIVNLTMLHNLSVVSPSCLTIYSYIKFVSHYYVCKLFFRIQILIENSTKLKISMTLP